MYEFCYAKAIVPTVRVDYIPVNLVDDVDGLLKAQGILLRCIKAISLIRYVEDAYNEFIVFKSSVTHPSPETDIRLERMARSYFLEFSAFLEHWQKYMSTRGKRDEFKKIFDKETHNAFDSSDAYALATMLRNYIAHSADLIQTKLWGGNIYDVGCSKEVLLKDDSFNKTKKAIIQRQPAQMILLTPLMQGSLVKLQGIHRQFLRSDFGEEEVLAAETVEHAIAAIKTSGLENREWSIRNENTGMLITTLALNGMPIETVPVTETHPFNWKEYEPAIRLITELETEY